MSTLNKKQIDHLQKVLGERLIALTQEIREDRERTAGTSHDALLGAPGDSGDESVASMMTELGIRETDRDVGELLGVEAALERIKSGDYGTCEDCGIEIGYKRLEAYPTAIRCIECQTKHERTHAGRGMPSL